MAENKIEIRTIRPQDHEAVVEIDRLLYGAARPGFFKRKIDLAAEKEDHITTSRVAVIDNTVVGFIMGDLYLGEFGIPENTASVDVIGVHPDFQKRGVAKALMDNLKSELKKAGVEDVITWVEWNDWGLMQFFASSGFKPGTAINLKMQL